MNLKTNFAGVQLENPTVLVSGILGVNGEMLCRIAENGAGAVTMKSIGPQARAGHSNPTVLAWEHGLINAVGLPSPGYKNIEDEWQELKKIKVPVIASIYGASIEEFVEVAEAVAAKKPAIIELNISCPNTKQHGMLFGVEPDTAKDLVKEVKKVTREIPLMPKLTPNTHKFVEVAKACEEAGANALSAINTLGPGMIIDINSGKPILANKFGGLSGPAIKPITVACIYKLYENVKLPILGMGGITSGKDAIELIQAGATTIGIGSAVYYRGIEVFRELCKEISQWMKEHNYESLEEFRGIAHG